MDVYAEEPPPAELSARCRFCLRSAEGEPFSRRDLTVFYSNFRPCGLGLHLPESELMCRVCPYCWARAAQCVKFVKLARAAELVLSGTELINGTELLNFYNLSIKKLEPVDYYCKNRAPTSSVTFCKILPKKRAPRDRLKFPSSLEAPHGESEISRVKCFKISPEQTVNALPPPGTAFVQKPTVKEENNEPNIDFSLDTDHVDHMNEFDEIKPEPNSDSDVSLGPAVSGEIEQVIYKTVRQELRDVEADKLRELRMESLQYSVADMLEEVEMKKISDRYLMKKYKCELCGTAYHEEECYDEHVMKNHDESAGSLECEVCRYRLRTPALLKRHLSAHARRWRCLDCGAVLAARGLCAAHRARCGAGGQSHACDICGKTYPSAQRLKSHARRSHGRRREKRFTCDICGKSFLYKHQMRDHIRTHLNIKPFECETCGKKSTTQSLHHTHLKLKHGPRAALEDRYCVECDRYFSNPRLLELHLTGSLTHVTKDTFRHACAECPERFKSASQLQLHINTVHLHNRAHRCQQCDKAYYTKGALKTHVRNKHMQLERRRDHVCSVCGKAFLASSSLKNHVVGVHKKERPYACDICGATFGFKAALYTHNKLKHKMQNQRADTASNRARFAARPFL